MRDRENRHCQILYSWSINTTNEEKLPAAIYHDWSYEAVRIIPAVAEKKRDRCISIRRNYSEIKLCGA